jgi:MFS family permease
MKIKSSEALTWQLVFVVASVSFSTWLPIGYTYNVTNAIQTIVLNWIRAVKCSRYEVIASDVTRSSNDSSIFGANSPAAVWCKVIPEDEENEMLNENTELNTIWGVVGATIATGAFLSLWTTNFWLDTFGSKGTLLYSNCFAVVGAVLSGLCVVANSFEMFIVGRLFLGIHIGIVVSVVPLFCTEISPPNLRGAMGTVPGIMLVSGSVLAIILGLPQVFGKF